MLSIALTKGRLEKASVRMFERCGYGVEELKNKGRQLVFHDTVKDNRYFLVKAADSVTYVEHGRSRRRLCRERYPDGGKWKVL